MAASRLVLFWILIVLRTAAGFLQEEEEGEPGSGVAEPDLNETVLCSNDQMKVVIPSIFFLRKDPPVFVGDLHLNDPECRGVEVGEDYVFSIKTNLSDCGTVMVSDQSHIMFTNSIQNNESQVISRNYVNITFSCRYPVRYLVQQPGGGHGVHVHLRTITLNTEDGNFSVSMLLFKDEAFEDRWTTVPSLRLEDHVFVKVFMIPAHLMLRMERCWATPSSDPYSNIQYTFIRDSCPVISSAQTLSVLRNGEGPDAAFRLQMFKFVGSSYTNVFLHCNIQICSLSSGQCQPNCSSVGDEELTRTRRDAPLSHTVSYGPIRRLLQDGGKPDLSGGIPAVGTLVLGGLLVLVLLLVSGVFGRLWHRSRSFYPIREAQLTLSNIHTLSEVAS
ncbi:hypothetical protein CgunFtcFv8_012378 [Champsocephalus gunnari]|uniref:ZP domain-containing protein n=1 Tax=Champsocephalus gunnari TaxID=52237 RepID=A0AAN8D6P7_CHAGU|nr:hypothetical protein CgunFtcFv8_012378 [Champsocephalus gunnari]